MRFPAVLMLLAAAGSAQAEPVAPRCPPCIGDFAISYPEASREHGSMLAVMHGPSLGSTHELTFDRKRGKTLWITAPMYDQVVEVAMDGTRTFHPMPAGAMPHGIAFDDKGWLYVSLEANNTIALIDRSTGKIEREIPVGVDPHGLGIARDGKTVWFTGKTKNTVGRLLGDGGVLNFPLPTPDALPIYIAAGRDGNMWFTELTGNKIGRVTPDGVITEFPIPTPNSRPIAIVPDPASPSLWFSQEAGNNIARIDRDGAITEFAVPKPQANMLLAGLAFDAEGNIWVQQYVDQNNPEPAGPDRVIRIGKGIRTAKPGDLLAFTFYEVPTRQTVMHRIVQGPDMNMWFTELKSDRFGRVITHSAAGQITGR